MSNELLVVETPGERHAVGDADLGCEALQRRALLAITRDDGRDTGAVRGRERADERDPRASNA